ncbi:MAG: multicopper oxidase domain-containing protein [Myxococcaceae bacterium]
MGWKDTLQTHPRMMTRIIVPFQGYPGRCVWHCHVLEHAANEMMHPCEVVMAPQRASSRYASCAVLGPVVTRDVSCASTLHAHALAFLAGVWLAAHWRRGPGLPGLRARLPP